MLKDFDHSYQCKLQISLEVVKGMFSRKYCILKWHDRREYCSSSLTLVRIMEVATSLGGRHHFWPMSPLNNVKDANGPGALNRSKSGTHMATASSILTTVQRPPKSLRSNQHIFFFFIFQYVLAYSLGFKY